MKNSIGSSLIHCPYGMSFLPSLVSDGFVTAGGPVLRVALGEHERAQALVLLAARGAAHEMGAKPGDRGVRVLAVELELDEPVELCEALVAADLGSFGAEQALEIRSVGHAASSSAS